MTPPSPHPRSAVNLVLFVMTFFTTTMVGGLSYATALLGILLLHEMGHYLMCRKHGVHATLPFFLPFPVRPLGTMGAVIIMRSPITNRKALFDIGMAGPLLGYAAIVPVTIAGIGLSAVELLPAQAGDPLSTLNEPLIFHLLFWILGVSIPEGYTLMIHPLAYAGWVGSLVTGLNLLPVGQLDGGHILYAMIGKRSKPVFWAVLLGLALITLFLWAGWVLFVVLLLVFIRRHPPLMDESEPLGRGRHALGVLMLLLFVLSFVPAPFPALGSFASLIPEMIQAAGAAAKLLASIAREIIGYLLS